MQTLHIDNLFLSSHCHFNIYLHIIINIIYIIRSILYIKQDLKNGGQLSVTCTYSLGVYVQPSQLSIFTFVDISLFTLSF